MLQVYSNIVSADFLVLHIVCKVFFFFNNAKYIDQSLCFIAVFNL